MSVPAPSGIAIAGFAVSAGVGLIFLTAGLEKFRHRMLLPGVVANYRLLPERLVRPVSALLPIGEVVLGLSLLAGLTPLPVLVAILLLTLFAGAMAINILRGRRHIGCGCGRPELHQALGWPLVLRNSLLVAVLLPRLFVGDALPPAQMMMAAVAGLGLFLVYALFHSIGALTAPRPSGR